MEDILTERQERYHTNLVQSNLRCRLVLFIVSEAALFGAIFAAWFYSAINPSVAIGACWPPYYIEAINPWSIPLLNTVILLFSATTLTVSHHSVTVSNYRDSYHYLVATLLLAAIFTALQR